MSVPITRARLYLSGMDESAARLAAETGCGYEITAFSYAPNLTDAALFARVQAEMTGIRSFWLHAPFAELTPCAIDPDVRAVAMARFRQTAALAARLGVHQLVIHGGYIPLVYFPEWYVEQSVLFWREFLPALPPDFEIALENVMEPGPELLVDIVKAVGDARLGLCLDVGHANTVVSQTPPLDWLAPMQPWLRHVHLHDNHGELDEHLPPGAGSMPISALLERLAQLPDVTITLETRSAARSLRYLQERGWLEP